MTCKKLMPSLWLALSLMVSTSAFGQTQILDSVVAIVEDDVIMSSELRDRLDALTLSLQRQGREMPEQEILVRQTLDRLILESIQLQMGGRAGVRISDAQLNSALNRIAQGNRLSLEEFRVKLEQEGKSYQSMREDVRKELILQRVQAGNVSQRIQISDQEIDNFLESEEGRKMTAEQYHLVHALLPVTGETGSSADRAAAARVEALYERIAAGESFEQVMNSAGTDFTGGDLGWRSKDDLPSLFSDIAPQLSVGETASPIRSASGYHLVYLAEKRGGEMMIQQSNVRHILLKPSAIRSDEETRQLADELREDIIGGDDFGELAREYSEDIGSAQEGGDLGWASPGQMAPEFQNVMDSTKVGVISKPFKTQFGWHILEVLDRRDEDVADAMIRGKAGEIMHQRKYQEELDAWLRKIRDEAFVDIK